MRNFVKVTLVLALCSVPMLSSAAVLTFGPVCSGACSNAAIPAGYGGFTWDPNFYAVSNTYYNNYGNTYGAPSGGAAFNGVGDPLLDNLFWDCIDGLLDQVEVFAERRAIFLRLTALVLVWIGHDLPSLD